MRRPVMTKFVLGQPILRSTGTCELTVTKDGQKETLALPIKSIGMAEAQAMLGPKPPEGDQDAAFEYLLKVQWAFVLAGLDIQFETPDGQPVKDKETIKQGLLDAGLTQIHMDKLMTAIVNLSKEAEEKTADFLSGNASDSPTVSSEAFSGVVGAAEK